VIWRWCAGPLAVVAVAASGCGNDACNQLSTAFQTLQTNTQLCPADQPTGSFNTPACEQEIGSCTSDDQSAIEHAAKCADGLPVCTPTTEAQFEDDEVVCIIGLGSLSPACANIAAPFIGTGTTGS